MMNCAALLMNVWVQWASRGSLENNAATMAAMGASSSTLHPLNASQIRTPSPIKMPNRPMRSERLMISALRE